MAPAVGSHVWVEDTELAWVDGEVIEVTAKKGKVQTSNGNIVEVDISRMYAKDNELTDWGEDDMTRLAYLHEPGVLHNLSLRYGINQIYTYTGSILIAINPFKKLPLYDEGIMESYKGMALGELPPHVFAVADAAYRRMIADKKSQSILVSGESGAGKTESTKMLMRYLAQMGGRKASEERTVEQQVLESNPVLEAFGNAKTVRNNNSSRFGKFVELQFDKKGKISGAAVRTYLLERSRVCQVSDPERNYHCFYMICAAPKEEIEKYKLGNPRTFHYLNQTNCYELEGVSDAKEYLATRAAMSIVGISDEEQEAIFRVISAILHLGNVEFTKDVDSDSSKPKDEKAMFHLKTAAELFMCDAKGLEDSLCKRIMVTRDESITKSLDPAAAASSRDALAKIVYSRLFDWLVNKINNSIGQDPESETLIGVLDIYGFESFKVNSFEQFCINLTNEKLQQHFNEHVFKAEQEEYQREEIQWSYIDFVDNQDVLELIEKKPGGILSLLDQACILPRSNHEKFAQTLYDNFLKHERFAKPKLSRTDFTIRHYAGDVTYQTEFFLDKNKDYVIPEHQALLSASGCPFVATLFASASEQSSKSAKFSSIGTQFKTQLQTLVETLNRTEPHYIRCIKPNNLLKPGIFENQNVLQQLRCGGVMEAIRISCAGYPTKRTMDEFLDRYSILCPEIYEENTDEKSATTSLLTKLGLSDYQIGRTKVFLRAGQMAELDSRRTEVLGKSAKIIQAKFRSYVARRDFLAYRYSVISLQSLWRGNLARELYENMRREVAAKVIQKDIRRYHAEKQYMALRLSAFVVQSGIRGVLARDEFGFRKKTKASIIIQAAWRRCSCQRYYESLKKASLVAQCSWKAKIARRELRKLKMAARETGALQEAKNKLEKQVEELTDLLQWERSRAEEIRKEKTKEIEEFQRSLRDMEEQVKESTALLEKERESAKETEQLRRSLQDMEEQVKEATALLEKEREAARKAIDQEKELSRIAIEKEREAARIAIEHEREASKKAIEQEIEAIKKATEGMKPFVNERKPFVNERRAAAVVMEGKGFEAVMEENEKLRKRVTSLEKKVNEAERNYAETKKLSEERLQKCKAAEAEAQNLKISLYRLEKKFSITESQGEVDKNILILPTSQTQDHTEAVLASVDEKTMANGHTNLHEPIVSYKEKTSDLFKVPDEADNKAPGYPKHNQENIDALIDCLSQKVGFSNGRPIAAWIIFKSLAHWRAFEAERTNVFDCIIDFIGSAIEDKNNDILAYWLSNTSLLFFFLHRSFKGGDASEITPQKRRNASFFERVTQGFRSASPVITGVEFMQQVEPKSPALLFKQQISIIIQTIYGILREHVKNELQPHLNMCIQAPRTAKASMFKTSRLHANTSTQQANINHWQNIVSCLSNFLENMISNHIPTILIKEIINEIFAFINVQLFNNLLLRRECCSFSNGEYIKSGLAELELWCCDVKEYASSAWDELKHIRQAVGFLVIHQKSKKSLDEIVHELCPVLRISQIYRISTMYRDDKYGTRSVAPDVLASMNALVAEDSNNDDGESLLLNDSRRNPLSGEDLLKHIKESDFSDITPPPKLMNNPNFQFLLPRSV